MKSLFSQQNAYKIPYQIYYLVVVILATVLYWGQYRNSQAYGFFEYMPMPRAEIRRYIPITEPDSKRYAKQRQHQKYNQTPPEQVDQAKNNYTFSRFGRLAFKNQSRLIQGVKFLEGCQFPKASYEFKAQDAVQFIFRNENDYTIHLIFSTKNNKNIKNINNDDNNYDDLQILQNREIETKLKEDEAINYHHVKIKPKTRRVWYWQFNRPQEFEWLCYDENLAFKNKAKIKIQAI